MTASTTASTGRVLALSGGVGGAKLACGLYGAVDPQRLTVVCNTADDFEHLGLYVSPDLDSVLYALSGRNDPQRGWGRSDEGWRFMEAVRELGGPDWFSLGDRDLALHVLRTAALRGGATLSEFTLDVARALGLQCTLAPMSDQRIGTKVGTDAGELSFQDYFVRQQCRPSVTGFRFDGLESAEPSRAFAHTLAAADLGAVILCPSNPFVSIDPILAIPGVEEALQRVEAPIVAVTPIVGGAALKGPAAKMMRELGREADALAVARHYAERDLLDGFVLDRADASVEHTIRKSLGVEVLVADTIMSDGSAKRRVASAALQLARSLRRPAAQWPADRTS